MYGHIKNFNTLAEFKAVDKQAFFFQVADKVRLLPVKVKPRRSSSMLTYRHGSCLC